MKRGRIYSLMAVLAVVFASLFAFRSAAAQSNRQVWAFYMGFWTGQSSWDAQASVLTDWPLIGPYSSHDPGVAGMQIEQAQTAGIDAFIVSWFGPDDVYVSQPTLDNMLARAAERGFRIGVAVDMFNADFGRDRVVNALRYLVSNTIHHSAYLRYNGKPVIFFAFQQASGFSAAEWQAIRNEIDPAHNTIWVAEGLSGCCIYGGAMDGMYAFNLAWSNGSASRVTRERNATYSAGGSFYVPTVHPGWDETLIAQRDHRPNPTSPRARNGGQFLTNMWNAALAANTDVILVVSWNEYMENHHIEPSVVYGNQSLDTLRPLVQQWEAGSSGGGSTPPPNGGPTNEFVEARYTLNVRAGPGTNNPVLGQIKPGTLYAVVGTQGSWYSITYNGQTGWVIKSGIRITKFEGGGAPSSPTGMYAESKAYTVNVRTGPGTSNPVLGVIKPGTFYAITGESGTWYSISYAGQTGWVAKSVVRALTIGG